MRASLAWLVVVVTTVAVALDTAFTAAHRSLLSEDTWAEHGWPLAPLASVGCAVMGALIVSRYPRHLLGWLLCAASLLSVTLAAEAYSVWVLDGDGPGSPHWAHVAAWGGPLLGWPAFTALVMVFLISPDGRLPSPHWRWAVWVTLTGLTLHTLGTLTMRPGDFVYGEQLGSRRVTEPLLTVGYLLVAAGLIASAASMALRLRKARDDVRRQLLWITSSAVFLALGVVVILLVPRITGEEGTWLAALPLKLAQVAVPLCVAVAVLRHRLLQIDLIVNRALVLTIATGLVAAGYVCVVVVVGLIVDGGTTGYWPSLVATAVVAMAFQPLRGRVVRTADRLAFGAAAAPYEALADFSRRLGDSPDPSTLLPAVADAVASAVNASRVNVVLHLASGSPLMTARSPAGAGAPIGASVEVPVVDRGELLGGITVEMAPGHPLRTRDHRLLQDLADQASMAFRSAGLAAELSLRVEQLSRRTQDLDESRSRLIDAADAERSRLELAISQQVLPHLTPLATSLGQHSHLDGDAIEEPDPTWLAAELESLSSALEALRDITRGVFPAQLARSGLATALDSLLALTGHPGRLVLQEPLARRRFEPRAEAAAYFCVAEASRSLQEVVVVLAVDGGDLHLVISGRRQAGMPLTDMRDRIETAGGCLSISDVDGVTAVDVRVPDSAVVVQPLADLSSGNGGQRITPDQAASSWSGPNLDLDRYAAAPDSATKSAPASSS